MYPDPNNLEVIVLYLIRKGISISYAGSSLVQSLHDRMKEKKCKTYKEYLSVLQAPEELEYIKGKLSINVTSFFRDPPVYDSILDFFKIYIGEIVDRSEQYNIKIWSAGCANGSEPFSIAILLHQTLKHHFSRYTIKIHATDINNEVLEVGKRGVYSNSIINEIPPTIIKQFFSQIESGYRVSSTIRAIIKFDHLDLLADSFPFNKLDMIFCRYVLMYFTKKQQMRLLKKFHELLNPGGLLILGIPDPMPLSEQNIFVPLMEQIQFLPLSIEDRIFLKPLNQEQRHKILTSLPEEELYCDWCGKLFTSEKKLGKHLKHDTCRHKIPCCHLCNKPYFSRTGLAAHLKYVHYIDRNDRITYIFNKNRQRIYDNS